MSNREPGAVRITWPKLLAGSVLISLMVGLGGVWIGWNVYLSAHRHKSPAPRALPSDVYQALEANEFDEALTTYAQLSSDDRQTLLEPLLAAGQRAIVRGQFSKAEQLFHAVLQLDAQHVIAHDRLASLYALQGRRQACSEHVLELIRQQRSTVGHLLFLSRDRLEFDLPGLQSGALGGTDDPGMLLVMGARAMRHNQTKTAAELLRQVVLVEPLWLDAQAMRGQCLLDLEAAAEFRDWVRQLPPAADEQDGIWAIRGLYQLQLEQPESAARCFWEAVRRNPNRLVSNVQLARILGSRGDTAGALPFAGRAAHLQKLEQLSLQISGDRQNVVLMQQIAEITESLGRLWEALAWSRLAVQQNPTLTTAQANCRRLQSRLPGDAPQTIAAANPAMQIDLSAFPLPEWQATAADAPLAMDESVGKLDTGTGGIRFVDRAADTQLQFTYSNDPTGQPGMRMLEFTGGGIAVLDYDNDGWPDVYFTQGAPWPPDAHQTENRNRLFRNTGDGRFQDVSDTAGADDNGYGQGVAAGDFNNDGFPDLYVANIGGNRLFANNGDGTFTDVTADSGIDGAVWTTSCAMADLNGDTWPDLYDVNYLADRSRYQQLCQQPGQLPDCTPHRFAAEQDRLLLSIGDGRFRDVTRDCGIVAADGNGLGIVVADMRGSGRLDLFVANDETPNFFFVNQTANPGDVPRFQETGVLAGLATDRDGAAQACMGIAAEDFDGDGDLDLLVTNFRGQANTLYCQESGDLFVDETRRVGLRDPSYDMVGFGVQFFDADLDGRPDLVVTNGHVHDLTAWGIPFAMPPQFFRNFSGRGFRELKGSDVGAWFDGKYLGRALARIDWNRDGREDFAVSHQNTPAALVTNESFPSGHFLALRLVGVESARDAIGTVVRVTANGTTWTKQLVAGDGYQATNQRQLVLGIGAANRVDELTVVWPSRREQSFAHVVVDRHVVLIEGRFEPIYGDY